ncbi:MAG: hypothetical protein SNJ84_05240 [Verrucomicrobiia bacterium]
MPKVLEIQPDFSQPAAPLRHSWAGLVNIDQFKWLSWSVVHEALGMAREELGAHTVRAVGMYGFASRVLDKDPRGFRNPEHRKPRSNFSMLHTYFDGCIERGVTPMFTTCFTPDLLAEGDKTVFDKSGNVTPPRCLETWGAFVEESVRRMARRYGRARMRSWMFEVWNEPNLEGGFWVGGQERWFELWKHSWQAIKRVDPGFRVGGPSTARGEWVGELLDFGAAHDCPPDYLITHCYNNDSASQPLSPFDGPQEDKANKSPNFLAGVVRGVRALCEEKKFTGEIHWNEWGRSWFPCDEERESENEAAFICKSMMEVSGEADYFAYWCLSDIYNQVGYGRETFHGNYGMLNQQNIRKPSYLAHQLLERLGSVRHAAKVDGGSPLLNAAVCGDEDRRQLLVYHFQAEDTASPGPLEVVLRLPAEMPWHQPKLFRITASENNSPARWRSAGAETHLSPGDARRWRDSSALRETALSEICESVRDGVREVRFSLEGRGVALLEWHLEAEPEAMVMDGG